MKKSIGLALLYIGAYITLLGGLFYMMHFYGASWEGKPQPKDYEWVWGFLVAVGILIGTVLAGKRNVMGFVGFGFALVASGFDIWLLIYGITSFNFLSPFILVGTIFSLLGVVLGLISHVIATIKAKKYGESLL